MCPPPGARPSCDASQRTAPAARRGGILPALQLGVTTDCASGADLSGCPDCLFRGTGEGGFPPLHPRTSFSREKEAKSKRHAPFGKNLWIARVWETGGAITLGLRRYLLRPLFGVFISARPCFRFPNRAGGFSVGRYRRRRGAACSRWEFRVAGGTWGQSLRPSSMATSLCTREALLRITSSCGEEHEGRACSAPAPPRKCQPQRPTWDLTSPAIEKNLRQTLTIIVGNLMIELL